MITLIVLAVPHCDQPVLSYAHFVFVSCWLGQVSRRRLRNTILGYLQEPRDANAASLCLDQFNAADCMTDKLAAVACLAGFDDANGACPERAMALSKFYEDAGGDFLVLNKWFGIQVWPCFVVCVFCVLSLRVDVNFLLFYSLV